MEGPRLPKADLDSENAYASDTSAKSNEHVAAFDLDFAAPASADLLVSSLVKSTSATASPTVGAEATSCTRLRAHVRVSIYTPPHLQPVLDVQSGILHAAEMDYKTAYSYFFRSVRDAGTRLVCAVVIVRKRSESPHAPPSQDCTHMSTLRM
ncbi:hypothetical protein B0H11DRAFT_2251858 [Mycena galericulata]|nr:hypothetical protein B0H11DRAFT_2251858 [Mycena galericulata]